MTDSPRSRFRLPHWGWFLLATIILVITGICLSVWLPWYREQQVIQMIEGWGGRVESEIVGPEWLQRLAGENRMQDFKVFARVRIVELSSSEIPDAETGRLNAFRNMRCLYLHGTKVQDSGLAQLGTSPRLEHLDVSRTAVTDAGLAHLIRLKNLERLDLHATAVTDAGMAALSTLQDLEIIHLDSTAVTDAGIVSLKRALPDCHLVR